MTELLTIDSLIAFLTLASLEIVLGIDNLVFISILTGKLEPAVRNKVRRIGLSGALVMRIGLLLVISWIMRLTAPLFSVLSHTISGRDIILLAGGLFLIGKSTFEIHENIEGPRHSVDAQSAIVGSYWSAAIQIMLLDIVFSLDSVITAVGMSDKIPVMVAAIIVAIVVMLLFSSYVGDFIQHHPSIKILALAFLLLIGVMLVAEGLGKHIERGYIYFAMGFSFTVELINMHVRKMEATTRK